MKNSARFYGALAVAIAAMVIAVYYLIPGVTHVRPMGGTTMNPATGMALIFFVVALMAGIFAVMAHPKAKRG